MRIQPTEISGILGMDKTSEFDRRSFLKLWGFAALAPRLGSFGHAEAQALQTTKADYTLHIGTARIELAPGHVITTTA
jgi:hypothetical protein